MNKKRILSADDSKVIRMVVKKYAAALGFEVIEACDGRECVRIALQEKPDLIVLDVNMPVLDGPQALVRLRGMNETKSTPVMIATTESGKELVVDLIRKGANQYIVKPFTQETFYKKLQALGLLPESFDPCNPA